MSVGGPSSPGSGDSESSESAAEIARPAVVERLLAEYPSAENGVSVDGFQFVRVEAEQVREAATLLGDALGYGRFIDLTAVDYPEQEQRFELQYLFYSMDERTWLRLKARTAGEAPSITPRFAGANWYEREVYDLFGVQFSGHPELTRIMLPDEWQGHPLRRDEPTGGEPVDFVATREIYGT
jgi:NADH-quinone oxidoreductase subunit C